MRRVMIILAAMLATAGAAATHVTASGTGWSVAPSPNPSVPTGQLFWVSCPAAKSCMAVGGYMKASGQGVNLAERWNGTSWRILPVPTPHGAVFSGLLGVACTSASACTAVGSSVTASGAVSVLAERWDGSRWREQITPGLPHGGSLNGVSCVSPTTCAAVGNTPAGTLAEAWNGNRWTVQATPNPAQGGGFLSGVSCTSASECTAVGAAGAFTPAAKTLVERWNGNRWTIQAAANPPQGGGVLTSVACVSASACTAVGLSNAGTLAESWGGTSWSIQPTPTPGGASSAFLNSVVCASASACTAAGTYNTGSGTPQTLVEHWDGMAWHRQRTTDLGASIMLAVSCAPTVATCTAIGYSDNNGSPAVLVERSSGTAWSTQTAPNPQGSASSFLNGVACWSRSACITVGATTDESRTQVTLAARWSGRTWRIQPTPNAASGGALNSISCTSSSACTAVGGSPNGQTLAERWNGVRWRIQPTPRLSRGGFLNSVSCATRSACTAVGNDGNGKVLAERWNGARWTVQAIPNPPGSAFTTLAGVACPASSACLAVGGRIDNSGNGNGTLAERWNGKKWRIVPTFRTTGLGSFLNGVACTSPSACTAVGSSGLVSTLAERWNGARWHVQTTPNPHGGQNTFLASVACPTSSACTAFGLNFTDAGPLTLAERWNGRAWRIQPTPAVSNFDIGFPGVGCPTASTCFAVASYKNNGDPSLTLIEQWSGAARPGQPTASWRPFPLAVRYLNSRPRWHSGRLPEWPHPWSDRK